jgi:circadian clock protein KaiB
MPDAKHPQPPEKAPARYVLRLYVAGRSSNGALALRNLTRFCELRLHGRYDLRVIDVLKEPAAASSDGVVATPTLIKEAPLPAARVFGTLADAGELVAALAIESGAAAGRNLESQVLD